MTDRRIILDTVEQLLATIFLGKFSKVCLQVASLYNPGADFRCFDGSNTIPFIQVNDDYCDCEVREYLLALSLDLLNG